MKVVLMVAALAAVAALKAGPAAGRPIQPHPNVTKWQWENRGGAAVMKLAPDQPPENDLQAELPERSDVENKLTFCRQELSEIKLKVKTYGLRNQNVTLTDFADLEGRYMELMLAKVEMNKQLNMLSEEMMQMKAAEAADLPLSDFGVKKYMENLDIIGKGGAPAAPGVKGNGTLVATAATTTTAAPAEPACSVKPDGNSLAIFYLMIYSFYCIMNQ